MDLNDLTFKVRGAIYSVHNQLGPGLLESVYEAALLYEFQLQGLTAISQVPVPTYYKGIKLDVGFRIDVLVENSIIIEIKSIEAIHDVHKKTLLTYLRLSHKKLGILVNFNAASLVDKESLIRIIN